MDTVLEGYKDIVRNNKRGVKSLKLIIPRRFMVDYLLYHYGEEIGTKKVGEVLGVSDKTATKELASLESETNKYGGRVYDTEEFANFIYDMRILHPIHDNSHLGKGGPKKPACYPEGPIRISIDGDEYVLYLVVDGKESELSIAEYLKIIRYKEEKKDYEEKKRKVLCAVSDEKAKMDAAVLKLFDGLKEIQSKNHQNNGPDAPDLETLSQRK